MFSIKLNNKCVIVKNCDPIISMIIYFSNWTIYSIDYSTQIEEQKKQFEVLVIQSFFDYLQFNLFFTKN